MITPADIFFLLQAKPGVTTRPQGAHQFRSLATAQQYAWPYAVTQTFVRPGARVLDWGCGHGHFSQFLVHAGYEVCAFAFGPPAPLIADLLRATPEKISYVAGSPAEPVQLPFADASCDAIASVGVLEHVRETSGTEAASLREIHRVLVPGGVFLCFHFPNRYSWIEGLTFIFPSRFHHTYRYTKADILSLVRDTDFELLTVKRYQAFPRNIFCSFPAPLRASRVLAGLVDFIDKILAVVLNPFCQNYGFVLRKRATTTKAATPA